MKPESIVTQMTKAEEQAQAIRQKDEQIKRLRSELREYVRVEEVLIAARLVNESKVKQAHELVQGLQLVQP